MYYLNMHAAKFKSHSSKLTTYFNLDISLVDDSEESSQNDEAEHKSVSLVDKMKEHFKHTVEKGKFLVRDSVAYQNLRKAQATQHLEWTPEGYVEISDAEKEKHKRDEHHVVVCNMNSKVVLMHLNPYIGKLYLYELEPNMVHPEKTTIQLKPHNIYRLQVVDGLIVVHDLDAKSTQVYDPKLPDFSEPLLYDRLIVD